MDPLLGLNGPPSAPAGAGPDARTPPCGGAECDGGAGGATQLHLLRGARRPPLPWRPSPRNVPGGNRPLSGVDRPPLAVECPFRTTVDPFRPSNCNRNQSENHALTSAYLIWPQYRQYGVLRTGWPLPEDWPNKMGSQIGIGSPGWGLSLIHI
eukprot:8695374-Pyramimonas_sp.AAC.1